MMILEKVYLILLCTLGWILFRMEIAVVFGFDHYILPSKSSILKFYLTSPILYSAATWWYILPIMVVRVYFTQSLFKKFILLFAYFSETYPSTEWEVVEGSS